MRAKYALSEGDGLLFEIFYNEISLKDLYDVLNDQLRHPAFGKVRKMISDTRGAKIAITPKELDEYIEKFKEGFKALELRLVIINDEPHTTALSFLIKADPFFKDKLKVCSTFEAAANWLGIVITEEEAMQASFKEII